MVGIWSILNFAGGVGLFLLGMRLMSEGLKVAAGDQLKSVLVASTRSRLRGLLSGALITAVVQASGTVIFATVGFVNAGLLTLYQSIGVIYGANLGTTLTSWVVALVGLDLNLQALALPLVAVGMALRTLPGTPRRHSFGEALVGFGLFFFGLDVLRDTFGNLGAEVPLFEFLGFGVITLILFLLLGCALTVLVQSSSASLAVTLTAAAGGLIPLEAAAATVIGANVGTTSIAIFAAIGATPSAKRSAAAHVLFNLVTALVAFAALPLLLDLSRAAAQGIGVGSQAAMTLAVFHTLTKLLGIALMWPLTGRLVQHLNRRFRRPEEAEVRPRHLDRNVLATPVLALEAAILELQRVGALSRRMVAAALSAESSAESKLVRERDAVQTLGIAIGEFVNGIERKEREPEFASNLPHLLRVAQYYQDMAERALQIVHLRRGGVAEVEASELASEVDRLLARAAEVVDMTGHDPERWNSEHGRAVLKEFNARYRAVKARLLRAGTEGALPVQRMVAVLDRLSEVRTTVEQSIKAAYYLRRSLHLRDRLEDDDTGVPEDPVKFGGHE